MSEVKKKFSVGAVVDRFRWAVQQFSDDQREELRSQLRGASVDDELVDRDLALAWLVATLGVTRELVDRELRHACDHKFVDSDVCLKCGVPAKALSRIFAPPRDRP